MAIAREASRRPGAFDIRNIIGLLLDDLRRHPRPARAVRRPRDREDRRLNANLWAGLALLALGIGFIALGPAAADHRAGPRGARRRRPDPARAQEEAEGRALRRAGSGRAAGPAMGGTTTVGDLPRTARCRRARVRGRGWCSCTRSSGSTTSWCGHADRSRRWGYLVLAPDLLARGRRPVCLAQTFVALRRGGARRSTTSRPPRTALLADPRCSASVGVIGFCLGGGFALVLAGRPGWDAAAANYGALPARPGRARRSLPGRRELRRAGPVPRRRGATGWSGRSPSRGVAARRQGVPRRRSLLPQRRAQRPVVRSHRWAGSSCTPARTRMRRRTRGRGSRCSSSRHLTR